MTKSIQRVTAAIICIVVAAAVGSFLLYELVFQRELKTLADYDPTSTTSIPADGCTPAVLGDGATELHVVLPLVEDEEHVSGQIARSAMCPVAGQKNLPRQLNEMALALQIHLHFNHQERAAIYLNRVYFGEGTYGIEQAAQRYFGVPATSLTLPQAALLVGLTRSPSQLSPYRHPDRAFARRNAVLQDAFAAGKISKDDIAASSSSPLGVK